MVLDVEVDDPVPRIGSAHRCFLPGMALHVETSESAFEEGRVEFVEKVTDMPMVLQANVFSTLERREEGGLDLTVDVHYRPSLLGRLMAPVLRLVMLSQFGGNALRFKRFVEARHVSDAGADVEARGAPDPVIFALPD